MILIPVDDGSGHLVTVSMPGCRLRQLVLTISENSRSSRPKLQEGLTYRKIRCDKSPNALYPKYSSFEDTC